MPHHVMIAHVMSSARCISILKPARPFGSGALADAIGKEPTRAACAHPPTHAWLTLRRTPCNRPRVCRARSTIITIQPLILAGVDWRGLASSVRGEQCWQCPGNGNTVRSPRRRSKAPHQQRAFTRPGLELGPRQTTPVVGAQGAFDDDPARSQG